ncbi:MAG: hypothetical protein CL843_06890 [Crocinitomicaceae bacterium]|nr:hypothetical protein [Crocinitomicaceae bacterium]|tara:strand:- start:1017 stop:1370 length:354 start_codon:yes stop_codon:yes gene_type:complete
MELSFQIAGIIGPVLMVLIISEYLNFDIWKDVHPTLVYLNGLVFLILGVTVIRLHNYWSFQWEVSITIFGWLMALAGILRMFFPKAKQLSKSTFTNLVLLLLFLFGTFLTAKAYFLN